jgi:choline kinase
VTAPPTTAVILAAGLGRRLGGLFGGRPKGLLTLGRESLVGRSIRLLEAAAVRRVVVVTGYAAGCYSELFADRPGVELLTNPAYETTGSMASLAVALEAVREDFLLLESDILYEPRALSALLGAGARDAVLASGPTQAGDEVWVEADAAGRLVSLSKAAPDGGEPKGEFVGIARVSRDLADVLLRLFAELRAREGHGRIEYDTGALSLAARSHPIAVHLVPDLLWGEIDDPSHYRRVLERVLPALGEEGIV